VKLALLEGQEILRGFEEGIQPMFSDQPLGQRQPFEGPGFDLDGVAAVGFADFAEVGDGVGVGEDVPEGFGGGGVFGVNAEETGERGDAGVVADEAGVAPSEVGEEDGGVFAGFHFVPGVPSLDEGLFGESGAFALVEVTLNGVGERFAGVRGSVGLVGPVGQVGRIEGECGDFSGCLPVWRGGRCFRYNRGRGNRVLLASGFADFFRRMGFIARPLRLD
jgi:hypothetical protein